MTRRVVYSNRLSLLDTFSCGRLAICLALIVSSAACLCAMGIAANASDDTAAQGSASKEWKNWPFHDTNTFPIAVWLQDPKNARRYKEAGINLYVALWRGPTDEQLAQLKEAGMHVICGQNQAGLAHKSDPTIAGWMHGDEPDNAQPVRNEKTGKRSYGPPIPPAKIVADYEQKRNTDPTRPVMLNLGQGVANDAWKGRGPGASLDDYPGYVKGGDIISYDVYPVAGVTRHGPPELWLVAKGLDRLVKWTGGQKILWNCIECTHIENADEKATPHQVRAEVWMSLVHGSTGIIYFVHEFKPKFNEPALLDDPAMLKAVTAINREIQSLAGVLNSPTVAEGVSVQSSALEVPIDAIAKRHGGATYVFAVAMREAPAKGTFQVRDLPAQAKAEVIGENRTVSVKNGRFEDDFGPYDVHLYKIR
jgi:hypothetical protein